MERVAYFLRLLAIDETLPFYTGYMSEIQSEAIFNANRRALMNSYIDPETAETNARLLKEAIKIN